MSLGVIVSVADVGLEVGHEGAAHWAGLGPAVDGRAAASSPAATGLPAGHEAGPAVGPTGVCATTAAATTTATAL